MLIHVILRYESATSPVDNPVGVQAMVDFADWMETQTEFADIRPLHVWWSAEKPPTAYAVLEAPSVDQVGEFLTKLPTPVKLELQGVRVLADVLEEGRGRLATWEMAAR
jgi:hypothetical protein